MPMSYYDIVFHLVWVGQSCRLVYESTMPVFLYAEQTAFK